MIAKVDTPRMVGKAIRLVNENGEIDSKGRVEIKINRMWATVNKGETSQNEIIA